MKRARRHRSLLAGLIALACLGVTVRQSTAGEEARQMLEGLRDRGLYDEALDYLEKMRTSPMVSEEFKETIDYEAGVTLVAGARTIEEAGVRSRRLEQAQAKFEQFIKAHPDHDLVLDATVQLGNVLTERGRFKQRQAVQVSDAPDEKERLAQEARALFGQAQEAFASAEKLHLAALKKFPAIIDPSDAETFEKRNRLRAGLLQERLSSALLLLEIGKTYEPNSKPYAENLTAAAARFHELYEKYGSFLAGHYARMWEGECYKDLGDAPKALKVFDELLLLPDQPKQFRTLKNQTLLLAMETHLLPDVKQYKEAVAKTQTWEASARLDETQSPEGLSIRYLAGAASLELARTLPQGDPQRREHWAYGLKCLQFVSRFPGERQEQARAYLQDAGSDFPQEQEPDTAPDDARALPGETEAIQTLGTYSGDALAGRGMRKARLVAQGGGSEGSERAVAMALKWLAAHQAPDGGWCFDHTVCPGCRGQCGDPGTSVQARNAATGLALLPFLGAGQTHKTGKYKTTVKAGLYFLVKNIKISPNGGSFHEGDGMMYSHGIATIALCEAYAMTHDKPLYAPSQHAINFIVYAQDPVGGGWRYQPRQPGDTSVTGWQILALKSGHMAYLRIPPLTVKKAFTFLDGVQSEGGANYGYTTPGSGSGTTAIGLLARMYLGWKRDNPALQRGITWLSERGPSQGNMYYNYYATQVMFHTEGDPWKKWNGVMRDRLIDTQATKGHEAGSWYFPKGDVGARKGGRLYTTALATMILEVYYRHLPIYRKQSTEEEFPLE